MAVKKNIFIIGANSFLGLHLLKDLDNNFTNSNFYLLSRKKFELSSNDKNNFFYFICDLADKDQVLKITEEMLDRSNRKIDYVIFLAISKTNDSFDNISLEKIDNDININIRSTIMIIKKILPYLIQKKSGHIINISSGTGISGVENASLYSMSKGAIQVLMESIKDELVSKNILITNFFTGYINNNNVTNISAKIVKNINTNKFNFFVQKYVYFSFLIKIFPSLKILFRLFRKVFFK